MTALERASFITIDDYLAGEETSGSKHGYLGGPVHRRKSAGGFAIEHHSGLDTSIPLPEIEASLTLADLCDQVTPTT